LANQLLKTEFFNNVADDDSLPPNSCIYSYDNVPVTAWKGKSRAKLPAMPISLPRGMGVYSISKTDSPDDYFIPIPSGSFGVIKSQDVLGDIGGQVAYEVFGSDVVFNKAVNFSTCFVRLVGVDISTVDDYTLLPIPADMEASIVAQAYQILAGLPPADKQIKE
jgi:hypothetical protein